MDIIIMKLIALGLCLLPIGVYLLRLCPSIGREDVPELIMGILAAVLFFIPTGPLIGELAIPIIFFSCLAVAMVIHWVAWLAAAIRKKPAGKLTMLAPCLPMLLCANGLYGVIAIFFIIGYGVRIIMKQK